MRLPIPNSMKSGDTIIKPFCNQSVIAQEQGDKLVEQGHDRTKMAIKPLASEPRPFSVSMFGRKPLIRNAVVPFGERRRVEKLDEDAPSESIQCEACEANTHETRHCSTTTIAGDTIIDPFCNHSVKAQEKGDERHSFDSRTPPSPESTEWLYCPVLVEHERGEVGGALVRLFNTLVVDRIRMPPIRVFKEEYCFVRITIEISDRNCQGAMPNPMGGVWPYTKQDALQSKDQLGQFDLVGWEEMPKGQLERTDFQEIKKQYREGRIPKQIRHSRTANNSFQNNHRCQPWTERSWNSKQNGRRQVARRTAPSTLLNKRQPWTE